MPTPTIANDRSTLKEYEEEIIAIQNEQNGMPSKEKDLENRPREFELLIDHQLGRSFPSDRREAIFKQQTKTQCYLLLHLFCGLVRNPLDPAGGLVRALVRNLSKVLTDDELGQMLELTPKEIKRARGWFRRRKT